MEPKKSQNTHYLPEWLLKKFREPLLYELDVFAGKAEPRNPGKAGSAQDLWPEDIEDNLSIHDNRAALIYKERIREKIAVKKRIVLSDSERLDFARWLAQFHVRIPNTREDFRELLEAHKGNPDVVFEVMSQNRQNYLQIIRSSNPDLFDDALKELGQDKAEECLLGMLAEQVASSETFRWPDHENLHQQYMRKNKSEDFACQLCDYEWVWLYSWYGFVIGDNPLVRWHAKSQRWNYGINRRGVEITMPLGVNLCLRLDQRPRHHGGHIITCTKQETRVYNCRQRLASIKYVYGNSLDALDFINKPITGWSRSPDRLR